MSTTDTVAAAARPQPFDPHRDGGFDPQPDAVRPSHAERARTLVAHSGRAMLATMARDPQGYPFGSLVIYEADDAGCPWVCISTMAEHTQNAQCDPRASIVVTADAPPGVDPLALARVSLIGDLTPGEPSPELVAAFLARHPGAARYVEFPDFGWWRLDVTAVRYVGGFGRMSWVDAGSYRGAVVDPIAPHAHAICAHMNEDHADAHVALIHHVLGRTDVTAAVMTDVDRLGCELDATTAGGLMPLRLPFPAPVTDVDGVRTTLVAMLAEARAAGHR